MQQFVALTIVPGGVIGCRIMLMGSKLRAIHAQSLLFIVNDTGIIYDAITCGQSKL